jgi:haloalkane dehalogenase
MDLPVVKRDFVQAGDRRVHYRIAGEGPPVLLLHQSPRNSAELVPLMQVLARHFLAIAPDTPGYGQSDPVAPPGSEPTIDVFADAVIALLDALGLERVALFGSHTGAIIAVRIASRYPRRITTLVANGILITRPEERSDKADRYLPPLVPQWDGGHLAWLWSRLRDQLVFYPWYRHDPAYRIQWSQSLEEIDASALDLLESGDNYRSAYGAVLTYDIAEDLPSLELPALLVVARTDALSRFVDSYPAVPSCVEVSIVPDFPDVPAATLDFLREQALAPARLRVPDAAHAHRLWSSFVDVADGQIHLRRAPADGGRTLLVLHDLGSSAAALEPMLRGMVGRRPLVAPDLPGHGESSRVGATTPDELAQVLVQVLEALGVVEFDVAAVGASAGIALSLRRQCAGRRVRMALIEPVPAPAVDARAFARALVPDLTADYAGSHLLRAWIQLRDRTLYFPWHDRSGAAQLPQGRPPRPVEQQRALVDLLKSRDGYAAQLEAALPAVDLVGPDLQNVPLLARPGAAIRRLGVPLLDLPEETFQWGTAVLRALDAPEPGPPGA